MVRVISLENALAQGETPATIDQMIKWHEAMLRVAERAAKQGKAGRRATSVPQHHRDLIAALAELQEQLEAHETAAAA